MSNLWDKLGDFVFPEYTDFSPLIPYEWTDADVDLIVKSVRAGEFRFDDDMEPVIGAIVVTGYDLWGNPMVERVRYTQ